MAAVNDETEVRGLDKDIAEKMAAKYDPKREAEAREYIEFLAETPFPSDSFQESLKDGVLLCKAINKILPEDPIKITVSKMPFKQMENIGKFLDRMEKVGVPAHERFLTVDLFEGKDLNQVVNAIFSLSRHAAKRGFQGPVLGPKLTEKNERNFTEEQLRQAAAMPSKLMSFSTSVSSGLQFSGRREIGGKYVEKRNSQEDVNNAEEVAPPSSVAEAVAAPTVLAAAAEPIEQINVKVEKMSVSSEAMDGPLPARAREPLSVRETAQDVRVPEGRKMEENIPDHVPVSAPAPAPMATPAMSAPVPVAEAVSVDSARVPAGSGRVSAVESVDGQNATPSTRPSRTYTPRQSSASAAASVSTSIPASIESTPATQDGHTPSSRVRPTLSITQFKTYAEYKAAKVALEREYGSVATTASSRPASDSTRAVSEATNSSSRPHSRERERPPRTAAPRQEGSERSVVGPPRSSSSAAAGGGAGSGRRRVEIVRERGSTPTADSEDEVVVFED